jgi:hypothetical protein
MRLFCSMQCMRGLQQEHMSLPALQPVLGCLGYSLSAGCLLLLVQLFNSMPARWACSCHVVNLLQDLPKILAVLGVYALAMQQQS